MIKRLAVIGATLLTVLGLASAPVQAAPSTHPAGVHAAKGMPPKLGTVRPATTCTGGSSCFYYVYGAQTISAPSIAASSYMANPYLNGTPAGGHSLQEIAAESADTKQIVEVGWTKDTSVCGSSTTPCLFTFAWVNGVAKCYNGCGFTGLVGSTYTAGQAVPSGDLSTIKNFQIVHGGSTPGWYVYYNGSSFGFWPDTLWSGASPPVTFTTGGYFQVFGEVAVAIGGTIPPCSDMGTGVQGSLGQGVTPKPSSWSSTQYGGVANTSVNLTVNDTYATGYSHLTTGGPSNVRSFSLGGPGANAAGTGVGTAGSC